MKNKKVIRKSVNNRQSGKVVSINVSKEKGVKKEPVTEAFIGAIGIEGDGHSGDWHRQVSILSYESIEEINKKGIIEVSPGNFAENITTKGINLKDLRIGDILVIENAKKKDNLEQTLKQSNVKSSENAKKVVLEVTQIGKECHNPCRIFYEMGSCIMPAEGIFCKVINTGKIKVGDNIHILNK
jgi:MOSC domain-containing protein YiiM